MIIKSSAPTRIGLFGGGTDVEPFSSTYGGVVLNLATTLKAHITLYLGENQFDIPRNYVPYLGDRNFMHKIFTHFDMGSFHDVRFDSTSDALLESGLGTSAASAVATIAAINKAKNLGMTPLDIAVKAWNIEVNDIGLFGGTQDQIAASFGGVNLIEYTKGSIEVTPLNKGFIDPLLPYLMLFYTGTNRKSAKIQEGFKHPSKEQIETLVKIREIASMAIEALAKKNIDMVAELLDQSWELKKQSNKGVTNKKIDLIYNTAKEQGAWGFKMLGAGGGGHCILICPPEKQKEVQESLEKIDLVERVDFDISWGGAEARIL